MPEILIGTSGYDYPEWRGVFYPAGLKRADFLPYYATQFNALELNSSFYNMPTAERLLSFWERSGGALKFSVKANRLLTHEIGRDWKSAAQEFLAALKPLAQNGSLASAWYAKENDPQEKECLQDHDALPRLAASPKSAAHDRIGSARYRYDYSDAELSEFAPVIQQAASQGRQVQVFFNNHPDGSGAKNARRMRELVER